MPTDILSLLEYELQRASLELGAASGNATFTWNGAEYPCTYVRVQQEYLNPGGESPIGDLQLTVQRKNLPTVGPELHQQVTFEAVVYEIQIIKDGSGGSLVYTCWRPGKGL